MKINWWQLWKSAITRQTSSSPAEDIPTAGELSILEPGEAKDSLITILRAEVANAKKKKRTVFAYFFADWCPPCRKLRQSLDHPLMVAAFAGTHIVKLNADKWGQEAQTAGFQIVSVPAFFALNASGHPTDRVDGDAWGDNTAENMAGPLGAFFRRHGSGPS